MEVRAEYRPVVPTGVIPTGLQDYHAAIPDLSPPRSQGSSTGGASSIGDFAPRMYTPPTPPTPHDDDKFILTGLYNTLVNFSLAEKSDALLFDPHLDYFNSIDPLKTLRALRRLN
uniref:Uncharacterized protein n=1 Tax=Vespula pensylvanica TaxID=30213 RepID=A0A834PEU3_VESPE|nr:hypothetical protein H0235_000789 [Vespula pensylvanica]